MNLIQVDILGADALKAGVDGGHNRLARKAALVRPLAPWKEPLGGDHHLVAPGEIAQRTTDNLLAGAVGITVGCVEKIDAKLERLANKWPALLLVQRPGMRPAL